MSALEPGLYRATVRGNPGPESIVMVGNDITYSLEPNGEARQCYVIEDARPLIVLDLDENDARHLVSYLEIAVEEHPSQLGSVGRAVYTKVAAQIEAQTKPARIPEPGFGCTVLASQVGECDGSERTWVRFSIDRLGWIDWLGHARAWSDLENPVLS